MKILKNHRGSVAVTFALSSVALFGVVSAAIEVGRVYSAKSALQDILDASALAAAKLPSSATNADRTNAADNFFQPNVINIKGIVPNSAQFTPIYTNPKVVELDGSIEIKTIFPILFFSQNHIVKATSTAEKTGSNASNDGCKELPQPLDATPQNLISNNMGCVWALNNSSTSMLFNSGVNINAPECTFYNFSSSDSSVMWNSGANVDIANLFSVGKIYNNTTPNPAFHGNSSDVVADPFAGKLSQPVGTNCNYSNKSYDGEVTLNPGTYCGWFNFNANGAKVKLNSGVYIVRGGGWNFNSAKIDAASGVTIFFEDSSDWKYNGQTSITLNAPTTGKYANIAMYEKDGLSGGVKPIDGPGGMNIKGLVYFPSKDLTFNSNNKITSDGIAIVGKSMIYNYIDWNIRPLDFSVAPQPSTLNSLINNGSFESQIIAANSAVKNANIAAWQSDNFTELHNGAKWAKSGGYGTDGVQYAKLNGDLYQSLNLEAGKTYSFSFDFHPSDTGSDNDSKFEIFWNDISLGIVSPTSGKNWQRISTLLYAQNAQNVIKFVQTSGKNSKGGALLDRVYLQLADDNSVNSSSCKWGSASNQQTLRLVK